jgi:hypothetical protein
LYFTVFEKSEISVCFPGTPAGMSRSMRTVIVSLASMVLGLVAPGSVSADYHGGVVGFAPPVIAPGLVQPPPRIGILGDLCAENGWYGDGICDADCPRPDPDCDPVGPPPEPPGQPDDFCAAEGWYGDGVCDEDCPLPDSDCAGEPPGDPDGPPEDFCAQEGWYGDGICDEDCPRHDPDCGGPPVFDDPLPEDP